VEGLGFRLLGSMRRWMTKVALCPRDACIVLLTKVRVQGSGFRVKTFELIECSVDFRVNRVQCRLSS